MGSVLTATVPEFLQRRRDQYPGRRLVCASARITISSRRIWYGTVKGKRSMTVRPISPFGRCLGKLEDRIEHRVDFVFELSAEPDTARLVIVDLVIDLDDRESVDSKLQRRAPR